jgi:TnpA family transposase
MRSDSHRLSLLTGKEIDELYGVPHFTETDRHHYFTLSAPEHAAVEAHTPAVAVHLTLQLGYFKAKWQLFSYEPDAVADDLRYILTRYFPGKTLADIQPPSRPTRLALQQTVLKLFDYHLCDNTAKDELERKTQRNARLSTQPLYLLREALHHLTTQRLVAPPYTFLQDMIGRVVTRERTRITHLLGQALTPTVATQLDALLEADEHVYRITALKREAKDFSYKELRQEVARRQFFQPLYVFAHTFLATAGLSNESSKYYASLVKFYTVYKLQRMARATARLYLLCFAYYRFRQINDNLIEAFIHLVDHYEQQAKQAAEDAIQRAVTEASEHLQAAGQVLSLFVDASVPSDAPFTVVQQQAFALLDPARFPLVTDYLRNSAFDKIGCEWAFYTTLSPAFKRTLRHLFAALDFAGRVDNAPLLEAVGCLQGLLRRGQSPRQANPAVFPTTVIPKSVQRYLFTKAGGKARALDVDRYEFLVYRLVRNALEAGNVFVRESTEFRRFEDDLISDARWQDKEAVLREIGAPLLLAPIQDTLQAFHARLDAKFSAVNHRIAAGLNTHITITGPTEKRRWRLKYPQAEEPVDSPFYSQLPGIGIAELLWFVAAHTSYLGTFSHVLDRYVKDTPDPRELLACIVAMGTNMGLGKMAEVSGLGYPAMLTTARNYLRLETLHAANDAITNAMATLPVFHLYDIQDTLHSSSDGQRIETQIDTINARHSPKYFGLHQGVSAYTLVANHVPINAKIIGTHEHESHYVFDVLYNNTSDIKPERHSTDTHGTNQVNFWILHVFGYQFAPRYRDLHKKMEGLVGTKHPHHYREGLIKPARKAYDALIVKEWPNIQRIMASLAQKDVTQATIVRKLASYARQNQTKKALWELENICRTLYILDFIDDVHLRQGVQKALNRGEAYHRFRRAVAFVNGGKFRVKTEAEQQIWNECARLITNAIIYYNMALLSKVYAQKAAANDQQAMAIIRGISPVAWQHVNLFGTFEFSPTESTVDLDALAARYSDPGYWSTVLQEEQEAQVS